MILVAPQDFAVPRQFRNATADPTLREALIRQVQRLRGSIYLEDGAIGQSQLSADGRHCTREDAHSWHMLFLNAENRISSAIWILPHSGDVSVDHLRVRKCSMWKASDWQARVSQAVRNELTSARARRLGCAEVGGWAVAPESRNTTDGLTLALGCFSLLNLLGGSLAFTTATPRHCSASILRRLGGSPLEVNGSAIPPYFDADYNCTMELLRFESRRPNPKYSSVIERLQDKLSEIPVIATAVAPTITVDTYEIPEVSILQPAVAF